MKAAVHVLTKQQRTLPTATQYERVQSILDNEPALRRLLSSKRHCFENRLDRRICVSKEAIETTNAVHSTGGDAIKVPKNVILMTAARVLGVVSNNGQETNKPASVRFAEPKPNGQACTVHSGGPVEFVENPRNQAGSSDAAATISTNSTGEHVLEVAVIPPTRCLKTT